MCYNRDNLLEFIQVRRFVFIFFLLLSYNFGLKHIRTMLLWLVLIFETIAQVKFTFWTNGISWYLCLRCVNNEVAIMQQLLSLTVILMMHCHTKVDTWDLYLGKIIVGSLILFHLLCHTWLFTIFCCKQPADDTVPFNFVKMKFDHRRRIPQICYDESLNKIKLFVWRKLAVNQSSPVVVWSGHKYLMYYFWQMYFPTTLTQK